MKTTDYAGTNYGNSSDGRQAKYLVAQSSLEKGSHPKTTPFGELVVAAFDEAGRFSSNPQEVTRLAASRLMRVLRHARNSSIRIQM